MHNAFAQLNIEPNFTKRVIKNYDSLLISKIISALMANDLNSARKFAKELNLPLSFVHNLRNGDRREIRASNLTLLSNSLGYELVLKRNDNQEEIILAKPIKDPTQDGLKLQPKHQSVFSINAL